MKIKKKEKSTFKRNLKIYVIILAILSFTFLMYVLNTLYQYELSFAENYMNTVVQNITKTAQKGQISKICNINNSDINNIKQETSSSNESNKSNEYNIENKESHPSANDTHTTEENNVKLRKINVIDQDSTSILSDSFKKDYGPHQVLDGDKSSVWAEGVDGPGYGESITLYFDSVHTVKQLKIVNGLINSYDGYYKNNRVASIKIIFSDGSSQIAHLSDDNTGYQTIDLSHSVDTDYITLTIDSVYSGYKYDDTCIAEVVVLGY